MGGVFQAFLNSYLLIKGIIKQFEKNFRDSNALYAIIDDETGGYYEKISIFQDIIDHRKFLQNKNRNLKNLHKRFVTNQVIKNQDMWNDPKVYITTVCSFYP